MFIKRLSAIACLTALVACSSSGGSDKNEGPENAEKNAQTSYLSNTRFDLRLSESFVFRGSLAEIEYQLLYDQDFTTSLYQHSLNFYDDKNRFIRSETKVFPDPNFPGQSNLAPEGNLALKIEHLYPAEGYGELTATMEIWDNWWDGASGRKLSHTTWRDLEFSQGLPTQSTEEVVDYGVDGSIASITFLNKLAHYNEQNLAVSTDYDTNQNLADGYEQSSTTERQDDGRPSASYNRSGGLERQWWFDELNRLSSFEEYDGAGNLVSNHSLTYLKAEQYYLLLKERYSYNSGSYETEVKIFESKTCHQASINRHRYEFPEYAHCLSKQYWPD